MMTLAKVVETLVTTTNNSPSQECTHPDDQTTLLHVTPGLKPFTVIISEKRVKRWQSRVQKSVQSNWRFLHQLNSVSPKRFDANNENLHGNHLAFKYFADVHSPSYNENETNSGDNKRVSLIVLWNFFARETKLCISLLPRYFTKEKWHRLTFDRWESF